MFKCEQCKNITRSGEKQHKKVIKTRDKIYNYTDKHGNNRTSKGKEIVKEINICEKCFEKDN